MMKMIVMIVLIVMIVVIVMFVTRLMMVIVVIVMIVVIAMIVVIVMNVVIVMVVMMVMICDDCDGSGDGDDDGYGPTFDRTQLKRAERQAMQDKSEITGLCKQAQLGQLPTVRSSRGPSDKQCKTNLRSQNCASQLSWANFRSHKQLEGRKTSNASNLRATGNE